MGILHTRARAHTHAHTHASFIRRYESSLKDGAVFLPVIGACSGGFDLRERLCDVRECEGENAACGFSPQHNKETKLRQKPGKIKARSSPRTVSCREETFLFLPHGH